MITLQQNSINLNFFMPSFEFKGSFLEDIRNYVTTMKKIYFLKRAFRFMIDDFDTFIVSNSLDNLENIETISEELYNIEERLEELLEIDGFIFIPIRRALQDTIYDCSSLATLLTGVEAEIRIKNEDR